MGLLNKIGIVSYNVAEYLQSHFFRATHTNMYIEKVLVGYIRHRGLKLDGAIGQGEICNSLKSEQFSKSYLSHFGKNKIKY